MTASNMINSGNVDTESLYTKLMWQRIVELKGFLRSYRLQISGNKETLVRRLVAYAISHGEVESMYNRIPNGGTGRTRNTTGVTFDQSSSQAAFAGSSSSSSNGGRYDGHASSQNVQRPALNQYALLESPRAPKQTTSNALLPGLGAAPPLFQDPFEVEEQHGPWSVFGGGQGGEHVAAFSDRIGAGDAQNPFGLGRTDGVQEESSFGEYTLLHSNSSVLTRGVERLRSIIAADPFDRWQKTLFVGMQTGGIVDINTVLDLTRQTDLFEDVAKKRYRVNVYCTNAHNLEAAKHEWPTAVSVQVNQKLSTVSQQCPDGRHRANALLERPCNIRDLVRQRPDNFVRVCSRNVESGPDGKLQEFVVAIVISKIVTVAEIVEGLSDLPRETGLAMIKDAFGDGEVQCDKMTVRLRDPVTFKRIGIPVKGRDCVHVQCFDAHAFVDFQRTARNAKFACYVCNKGPIVLSELVRDPWFAQVLADTDQGTDTVEYFADGSWEALCEDESDDDDDCAAKAPPGVHKRSFQVAFDDASAREFTFSSSASTPVTNTSQGFPAPAAVRETISLLSDDDEAT